MIKDKIYKWEDITLDQFNQIQSVKDMKGDEIDFFIRVLSILDEVDEDEYYDMPVYKLNKHFNRLNFISTPLTPRMLDNGKYILRDREYELTPSVQSMTAGQYIDYTNILKDTPDNTSMLLATLLVPVNYKYGEGYDINELSVIIEQDFKIVDVIGITTFFQKVLEVSSIYTLTSSIKTLKKEMQKEKDRERRFKLQRAIKEAEKSLSLIKKNGLGS